jgi:dihydroorotate dehydrogenase
MYQYIQKLLFSLEPERAHILTLNLVRLAGSIATVRTLLKKQFFVPAESVEAFGLKFSNPIGLAAGYDKDGIAWRGLACLGFGHIEIGTVTPQPQPGNSKPRLFRLLEDKAIINRMGFPGQGADFVAKRLSDKENRDVLLGINIGKNRDTLLESAVHDYISLIRTFAGLGDYFVVNVSSPNTIGLRRLQGRELLVKLLAELNRERDVQVERVGRSIPMLVKLSPDLSDDELADAVDVIINSKMDGIIATNTTTFRDDLKSPKGNESGGLSGVPLHDKSIQMIRKIQILTKGELPIIGVGGVDNAISAQRMLDAGAVLVQLYTGLIYRGPGLVKEILENIKLIMGNRT